MQASKDANCDVMLFWYWKLFGDFVEVPSQAKITSYFVSIEKGKEARKRKKKTEGDDEDDPTPTGGPGLKTGITISIEDEPKPLHEEPGNSSSSSSSGSDETGGNGDNGDKGDKVRMKCGALVDKKDVEFLFKPGNCTLRNLEVFGGCPIDLTGIPAHIDPCLNTWLQAGNIYTPTSWAVCPPKSASGNPAAPCITEWRVICEVNGQWVTNWFVGFGVATLPQMLMYASDEYGFTHAEEAHDDVYAVARAVLYDLRNPTIIKEWQNEELKVHQEETWLTSSTALFVLRQGTALDYGAETKDFFGFEVNSEKSFRSFAVTEWCKSCKDLVLTKPKKGAVFKSGGAMKSLRRGRYDKDLNEELYKALIPYIKEDFLDSVEDLAYPAFHSATEAAEQKFWGLGGGYKEWDGPRELMEMKSAESMAKGVVAKLEECLLGFYSDIDPEEVCGGTSGETAKKWWFVLAREARGLKGGPPSGQTTPRGFTPSQRTKPGNKALNFPRMAGVQEEEEEEKKKEAE